MYVSHLMPDRVSVTSRERPAPEAFPTVKLSRDSHVEMQMNTIRPVETRKLVCKEFEEYRQALCCS